MSFSHQIPVTDRYASLDCGGGRPPRLGRARGGLVGRSPERPDRPERISPLGGLMWRGIYLIRIFLLTAVAGFGTWTVRIPS